jgi:superfamily II DNA helicase RecQ
MSRKVQRVKYHLDASTIRELPPADIKIILRGADDLIATGGRSLLTKILRGSRAKDVVSRQLDRSPVYGVYRELSEEDVLARIDWTILNGYLQVIYEYRLPVLVYTPAGWDIERETCAEELVRGFDELLAAGQRPYDMSYLKDRNREVIWRVLDIVAGSGEPKYVPVLEDWERTDFRKVRQRIRQVIQSLVGSRA